MNWIQMALAACAAFALAYLLHTIDIARIERKHIADKAAVILLEKEACTKDKIIAKEANDELLKSCTDRLKRINAVKLQPPRCINVSPTKQAEPSGIRGGSAKENGLSSQWLQLYASEYCKRYYDDRIILEKFIDDTWKANNQ